MLKRAMCEILANQDLSRYVQVHLNGTSRDCCWPIKTLVDYNWKNVSKEGLNAILKHYVIH
jgi:hypothetical protein